MTRLTTKDVKDIPKNISRYDDELRVKLGASLAQIAQIAAGFKGSLREAFQNYRSAVVPITTGKGEIKGFAEATAAIINYLGLKADTTEKKDAAGLAEAISRGSNIFFMADDKVFTGLNLKLFRLSYNHGATGRAYATSIEVKVGSLKGKHVALIGTGKVGKAATEYLYAKGAEIHLFDLVKRKAQKLAQQLPGRTHPCDSLSECLRRANIVLLAAPGRNIIPAHLVSKEMVFSIPAIPLGLTPAAIDKLPRENLIHDTLELGVATMVAELVR